MTFFDTNVVIDVLTNSPDWADWSVSQVEQATKSGAAFINFVVFAELGRNYPTVEAVMHAVAVLGLATAAIDDDAAFLAGQRFNRYKRARATDQSLRVLPDFFIGAHALVQNMPLVTRDRRLYRTYFPDLTLITPETDA